jgi:hypothetical protein
MPTIFRRLLNAATCVTCWWLLCAGLHAAQSDETRREPEQKLRLAVIGASASAGFGIVVEVEKESSSPKKETDDFDTAQPPETVKRMIRLVDLIDEADQEDRLIELDLSSHMFFTRPFRYGRSSVDRTLSWKPDLVFAIDFLFWYVYGAQPEETRVQTLEKGLEELERLAATGVPIVIGTVPDLYGVDSFVLMEDQIPETDTVKESNRLIEEWAKKRENVAVVPIFELNRRLSDGGPIEIGPHTWHPKRDRIELIAPDKLHPTYEGLICLAQAIEVELKKLDTDGSMFPDLDLDQATLTTRMRIRRDVPVAP